ncbi:MAG TPA: hypothetical protein PLY87_29410 [Planctomycetaceae bacterium]|nr:hypothetical protein [Planctomycetaceae bacterium]
MTNTALKLLAAFDSLPANDQHELLAEMLRRSGELPEALMSGDDLATVANELFQALDDEESDGQEPDAR